MLTAGRSLGPYRILAPLGAGGMGEVYRAHDPRLRRDVAVKVLAAPVAATPDARARFEREARTISQLSHPHICALFDVGQADGIDYLVMELLEGETLAHRLARGPLPVADVLTIGRQIAEALDGAHQAGVVHRDLKPGNVMLTRAGVKLMDFGLARVRRSAPPAPDELTHSPTLSQPLTAEGAIVGTIPYMAPEQLEGGDPDARSDLWALGCVLYEMATAQRAFAGGSQAGLIAAILAGDPRPMTELRPGTPEALERVVRRCLAKDPRDRFQDASDLAFALGEMRDQGSGASRSVPGPEAAGHGVSRLRAAVSPLRVIVVLAALVAAVVLVRFTRRSPAAPPAAAHARTEIAVLPLRNLSAGGPHAYFAGGLHDEVLTQLAGVAALKVISRTSVMGYADTTKPLKQIAAELGVGSIVEGSVQVEGERLRVNVQLIDAATDQHLWAEHYDRTLDDAFAIQSDVAQQIVNAVGTTLSAGERQAIATAPTANAEAYRLYLQGRDYQARPGWLRADLDQARQCYERALALDGGFALAHAALSVVHASFYWFSYDTSPARIARMQEEAEIALRLAPALPEAHVALGRAHYWGHRDYRRALEEIRIALLQRPGDADAWFLAAGVERRLGHWSAADTALQNSVRLNPRDAVRFDELGNTYAFLRRYGEAIRAFDRALELVPEFRGAAVNRAYACLAYTGETRALEASVRGLAPTVELGAHGPACTYQAYLFLLKRQPDSLLAVLRTVPAGLYSIPTGFQTHLYRAWGHRMRGDPGTARTDFQAALAVLDTVQVGGPDAVKIHWARGLALAGLGRTREALVEAQELKESLVYRQDAYDGPRIAELRANVLAQAGAAAAALDEIERLLAGPSDLSAHALRLDPIWDPIREEPRFKLLLAKYGTPGAR